MKFFRDFLQKHKWLLFIWITVNFFIIFLPQWINSVWSLAEKIIGQDIGMSLPNFSLYYVTIPVGLIMFIFGIWAVRSRKATTVKVIPKSDNLIVTLTAMHRHLVELQKEKASRTKVSFKQFEKYIPTLAHKLGIVTLDEWPKFNKDIKRKIQAKAPKPKFSIISSPRDWVFNRAKREEHKEKVYQAALVVASETKDQLFGSKEWKFQDAKKASDWADGYDWGIQKIRDNDPVWDMQFKSISHYSRDRKLRKLIQKHIDLSHMYANHSLVISYSEKFRKDSFSFMLHETLVGSPISPEKAESALSEILSKIEKHILGQKGRTNSNLAITYSPMDKYMRVHECSQCGWGFEVYSIMFGNTRITCPKCGNIENNTHT